MALPCCFAASGSKFALTGSRNQGETHSSGDGTATKAASNSTEKGQKNPSENIKNLRLL